MDTDDVKYTEERQHYRIDDTLEIGYFTIADHMPTVDVTEAMVKAGLFTGDEAQHYELMQQWYRIDDAIKKSLRDGSQGQSSLSECLGLFNQKLQLLAQQLFNVQQRPRQTVNLSVGGLAFYSKEAVNEGSRMKLKLILHPSLQGFICTARVVLCRHLPKKHAELPYRLSVKFIDLSPEQQQRLQQHIMQRQLEARGFSDKKPT